MIKQTFSLLLSTAQVAIFMLISKSALAAELPDTLKYLGKPISPLCFKDTMTVGPESDLKVCNDPKLVESIEIIPEEHKNDDSIGYRFKYRDQDRYAYVYYRYIGSHEGREVILINVSGGGTGQFSFVEGMKRNGDKLIDDKSYAGGDRCNGSINNASIVNRKIIINQSVTPADLYNLAGIQTPDGSKPYKVLDSSPLNCLGSAQYEDGKFIAYTPSNEVHDRYNYDKLSNNPEVKKFNAQDCLMDLYKDMPLKEIWTPAQVKELMTRFNQTCFQK